MRVEGEFVRRPLVGAALALVTGIVLGPGATPWLEVAPWCIGVAALVLVRRRTLEAVLAIPFLFFWVGLGALPQTEEGTGGRRRVRIEGVVRTVEPGPETVHRVVSVSARGVGPSGPWSAAAGAIAIGWRAHGGCGGPGDRIRALVDERPLLGAGLPGRTLRSTMQRRYDVRHRGWGVAGACVVLEAGPESVAAFRLRAGRAILEALEPNAAAVVRALATGHRGGMPEPLAVVFRRSGLGHLLAISGMHLGIVIFGLFVVTGRLFTRSRWICRRFGAQRAAAACILFLLPVYVAFVGAGLSVLRASFMVAFVLIGRILERPVDALNLLALAAIAIAATDPGAVFSPGCRLSFLAVLSLLLLAPGLGRLLPTRRQTAWSRLVHGWAAGLAVMLGTAPTLLATFSEVSLVGPFATILVLPFVTFALVPASLCGALLVIPYPRIGIQVLRLAGWCAERFVDFAALCAAVPPVRLGAPSALETSLYFGALWCLLVRFGPGRFRRLGLVCAAALIVVWAGGRVHRYFDDELRLFAVPVGQGDAMLLELPGNSKVVVDTGTDSGTRRYLVPFLKRRGIRTIDVLVLTHRHADHAGGLEALAEAFEIKSVWVSPGSGLEARLRGAGLSARRVAGGRSSRAFGEVDIDVLGPVGASPSENDRSVVLRVRYRDRAFLLMGDAERHSEAEIVDSGTVIASDVLKVGHHGSRTSSGPEFLAAVRPRYAVINVARFNGFALPHGEVLERLDALGVRVFRTDLDGLITVRTDGHGLSVDGFRPRHAR